MRLFTAIDLPQDIRETFKGMLERLRPLAELQWSPLEKLHITTKFIGEWPESRLNEITNSLSAIRASAIEIAIHGIDWLPNPRSARVLYAGVDAADSLVALASATERELVAVGVSAEKRAYRPHVTLARTRDRVPLGPLKAALRDMETSEFGHYRTNLFALYLSANGKYTRLQEFRFTNP